LGDFFTFLLGFLGFLFGPGFRGVGFLPALFLGLFPLGQFRLLPAGLFLLPGQIFLLPLDFLLLPGQIFLLPLGFLFLPPRFFLLPLGLLLTYPSRLGVLPGLLLPLLSLLLLLLRLLLLLLNLLLLLFGTPLLLFNPLSLGRRFFPVPFYILFFFGNGFPLQRGALGSFIGFPFFQVYHALTVFYAAAVFSHLIGNLLIGKGTCVDGA
jgi:hypothetical protein